jgi:hypothetical protein
VQKEKGSEGIVNLRSRYARKAGLAATRTPLWDYGKEAELAREIDEGHCGALPDSMLEGLARAQRARDAVMADTLARAGPAGAVLIAGDGAGHLCWGYGGATDSRRGRGGVLASLPTNK